MTASIHVNQLGCGYGDTAVLRGIDLSVTAGRIHALIGLNGAGKTTLMRGVLGTLTPTFGTVTVFGQPAATADAAVWRRYPRPERNRPGEAVLRPGLGRRTGGQVVTALNAAIEFEWLKLRRATVTWVATAVLVLAVPLLAAGLLAASRSDSDSQLALKARTMVTDTGWSGQFMVTGQILSVAVLIVVGIVACWTLGREFTDHTIGALLSSPTSRGLLASAKFLVVTVWAMVTCAAAVITTVLAGLATGSGGIAWQDWTIFGKLFLAALLTIGLTAPLALAASLGRGYLTGIAILFGVLVVTQIATAAGLGGWFPYAAPGLWLGLGGPEAAAAITTPQLLLPIPVTIAAIAASLLWWNSAKATRSR